MGLRGAHSEDSGTQCKWTESSAVHIADRLL